VRHSEAAGAGTRGDSGRRGCRRAISTQTAQRWRNSQQPHGDQPRITRVEATSKAGSGHDHVRPVDHSRDPDRPPSGCSGDGNPVADDAPALAHRPDGVGEPGHGLLQTAEAPARDPAFEAGEMAVEGHELTLIGGSPAALDVWPSRSSARSRTSRRVREAGVASRPAPTRPRAAAHREAAGPPSAP